MLCCLLAAMRGCNLVAECVFSLAVGCASSMPKLLRMALEIEAAYLPQRCQDGNMMYLCELKMNYFISQKLKSRALNLY
jgi:hypothetical protein